MAAGEHGPQWRSGGFLSSTEPASLPVLLSCFGFSSAKTQKVVVKSISRRKAAHSFLM